MKAAPRIKRPGLLGLLVATSAAAVLAACVSLINLAASMEADAQTAGPGATSALNAQH
jgi:hypothetical protein